MGIVITYDPEADALAVDFTERRPGDVARTQEVDEFRRIDLDAAGRPLGLDLTSVSEGVRLDGLPFADEVAAALRGFPQLVA